MRKLVTFFSLVFFISACGSAPKHVQTSSSGKKGNHAKRSGQSYVPATGDDSSLEDMIYASLGSKKGSGVRYSQYIEQNGKFDIPITQNEAVDRWIDYFTGKGREHFERYLTRSGRFIPYMHSVLIKYNLPKDLVYLSMIESGFNTRAMSWAAAGGLWQFIRSTGALYGLSGDYYVDERADVEKATDAAARHLKDLYDEFGDWYLAFAAYNAGAGKIRNAVNRYGSNFWEMAQGSYLRQETKDYVPKILAAAIISKSPAKYGFTHINYELPIDYERVKMKSATDLEVVAECAGVDPDLIRLLNPELLRDMTPPNVPNYSVKIPRGTRDRFDRKYASLSPSQRLKTIEYTVERGDTPQEIAANYGISEKDLINENLGRINVHHETVTRTERVEVRRHKFVNKKVHYTTTEYSVAQGTTLTIPKNRTMARNASTRDDAAAHAAKDQYGLRIADEDVDTKKGKKDKKKNNKDKQQIAKLEEPKDEGKDKDKNNKPKKGQPLPDLDHEPTATVAEKPPAKSDLDSDLFVDGHGDADRTAQAQARQDVDKGTSDPRSESKVPSTNQGTPMAFNDKVEGMSPSGGSSTATAPSDADLKDAVEKVRTQNSDLAQGDTQAPAPAAEKKWVPASDTAQPEAKEEKAETTTGKIVYHLVKAGETLKSIAEKYGVTIADLKAWNGKKVIPNLKKGTKIVVAQGSSKPGIVAKRASADEAPAKAPVKHASTYKVKPGDSLAEIADNFGVTVEDLKAWNGRKVSPVLQKNAVIKVAGAPEKVAKAAPKAEEKPVHPTRVAQKPTAEKKKIVKYKVKPGDSLIMIAKKHSTTPEEIQKLNGLKGPKIVPGAVIVVQEN